MMKKEVRDKLKSIEARRKAQIKMIEDNYIKPLKDDIKLNKEAQRGSYSVKVYVDRSLKLSKWWMELINGGVKGGQKRRH
jgi:hypothetical protein